MSGLWSNWKIDYSVLILLCMYMFIKQKPRRLKTGIFFTWPNIPSNVNAFTIVDIPITPKTRHDIFWQTFQL